MNMRLFTVLGAIAALAISACTTETDTGDSGDGGTGGGSGGSGNTGNDGGTGGGTGGGGGTGAVCDLGTDGCVGCGELITFAECTLDDLCTDSAPILEAIQTCTCMNCMTDCGDNACADPPMDATAECQACAQMACPMEAGACANDISD